MLLIDSQESVDSSIRIKCTGNSWGISVTSMKGHADWFFQKVHILHKFGINAKESVHTLVWPVYSYASLAWERWSGITWQESGQCSLRKIDGIHGDLTPWGAAFLNGHTADSSQSWLILCCIIRQHLIHILTMHISYDMEKTPEVKLFSEHEPM